MLSFGEAVRQFYGNYANAEGRAQRSAYWWAQLYQLIIALVLIIVILMSENGIEFFSAILDLITAGEFVFDWSDLGGSGQAACFLMVIFGLVNFIPNIMLSIRRFHDLGQTGWLVLAFFVAGLLPFIGSIADIGNLIWFIFPGTKGPNEYGSDPLGHDTDIFG